MAMCRLWEKRSSRIEILPRCRIRPSGVCVQQRPLLLRALMNASGSSTAKSALRPRGPILPISTIRAATPRSCSRWESGVKAPPRSEAALNGDDDFASGMALREIPDRICSFTQSERPVDDRRDLARLHELTEGPEVLLPRLRGEPDQPLMHHQGEEGPREDSAEKATGPGPTAVASTR